MKQSLLFFLIVLLFNVSQSQNVIGPSGDVGIGISPASTLHVFKNVSGNTTPLLILQDGLTTGSTHLQFKGTGKLFNMGVGNNAETTLGLADKFYIYDQSSGSARFVIDATGNIGIGTTAPYPIGGNVKTIDIHGSSGGGIYTGTTSAMHGFFYSWIDNDVYSGSVAGNLRLFSNSVERIHINIDGNVGIGTESPQHRLHVKDDDSYIGRLESTSVNSYLEMVDATATATANRGLMGNYQGDLFLQKEGSTYGINFITGGTSKMKILNNGNVGIGIDNPGARLAVNGDVFAKKVKVTQTGWPDYVFYKTYKLLPLSDVEKFIAKNSHLPEMPSAAEVEKNGVDLGDNQATLLKKIEELTLYLIEQNKRLDELTRKFEYQRKEMELLKTK